MPDTRAIYQNFNTDLADRLYAPTAQEAEEHKRLYMTCENARKTVLGEKTQTRRIIDLPDVAREYADRVTYGEDERGRFAIFRNSEEGYTVADAPLKYKPGEIRLVTTPHWRAGTGTGRDRIWDPATKVTRFRTSNGAADRYGEETEEYVQASPDWHQIHASFLMPTWASRIAVEVEDVWVERIQEISPEDTRAEGIRLNDSFLEGMPRHIAWEVHPEQAEEQILDQFAELWEEIHGEEAWERNDWVRCVEYSLITES